MQLRRQTPVGPWLSHAVSEGWCQSLDPACDPKPCACREPVRCPTRNAERLFSLLCWQREQSLHRFLLPSCFTCDRWTRRHAQNQFRAVCIRTTASDSLTIANHLDDCVANAWDRQDCRATFSVNDLVTYPSMDLSLHPLTMAAESRADCLHEPAAIPTVVCHLLRTQRVTHVAFARVQSVKVQLERNASDA